MKGKLIFAASLLGAGVAFGGTTVLETDEYIVGVLPVSLRPGQKEALISIPWVEAGSASGVEGLAVINMVKTANLHNGDLLFWYNTENETWYSWVVKDGEWAKTTMDFDGTYEASQTTATDMLRGQAVLLRIKDGNDTPEKVYIVGQKGDSESEPIAITKGRYTVIAPPKATDTDLNSGATWTGVQAGDLIAVDAGNGGKLKFFRRNGDNTAWVPNSGSGNAVIAAGYGAFYIATSGGSDRTVTWNLE